MDGTLTIEEGTLHDFITFCCRQRPAAHDNPFFRLTDWLIYRTRRLQQYNPVARARRNVAHHYDLSDTLYDLFWTRTAVLLRLLHRRRRDAGDRPTQQEAPPGGQAAAPAGQRSWTSARLGGLALYLAGLADLDVTGVTLSEEQHLVAARRAADAGLDDRVHFLLQDYRRQTGPYDRIVSVGMFEHVGPGISASSSPSCATCWPRTESPCCTPSPDGAAGTTSAWLRKYIFPGGYTPAMSEVLAALERERLYVTDIVDPEAALRQDTCRIGTSASRPTANGWPNSTTSGSADVGVLPQGLRDGVQVLNQMVFQMQITRDQAAVPADARLHHRLGARPAGRGGRPSAGIAA